MSGRAIGFGHFEMVPEEFGAMLAETFRHFREVDISHGMDDDIVAGLDGWIGG